MLYIPQPLRQCTKCQAFLPWSAFTVSFAYADNLTRQCRKCHSAAAMEYHRAHPESAERAQRKYNKTDKAKRRYKRYYDTHKTESREKCRRFFEKNPNYTKERYAANPTKERAKIQRRLARKRNLPDKFTDKNWEDALNYFGHRCAVCGRPRGFWHTLATDHWIPLTDPNCPGTVPWNIVPLCHGLDGCNNKKHDYEPFEWLKSTYGLRQAKIILKRIEDYFAWVRSRSI